MLASVIASIFTTLAAIQPLPKKKPMMALNSVGEALREISLAGAPAAEDRLSPLTEVLGVELLQHLDAVSLCRLSLCARLFSKDSTTPGRRIVLEFPGNSPRLYSVRPPAPRRLICEDVARERALDLMDEHVAGLCALEGVSSVRELGHEFFFRPLQAAFYKHLAEDGCCRFPYLPDGLTRRPKRRWPKGRHGFQGWFHILDALEAGPVAAWAAAEAVCGLAIAVHKASRHADSGRPADAVLAAAREAATRALLARSGEFEVDVYTRQPLAHDDERIAALVRSNGGSRWVRSLETYLAPYGTATFPSLLHAIAAKDALRADEAMSTPWTDETQPGVMHPGAEWNMFFAVTGSALSRNWFGERLIQEHIAALR